MTREETDAFLVAEYVEALRYMDNAKDALKKADRQDDGYYHDKKYVKTACGVAYVGVLQALDAWFAVKGVPELGKNKHKSIDFYKYNASKLDKKLLDYMETAYNILHLSGYYRRETNVKVIESGFDAAYDIIGKIKPENPEALAAAKEAKETGANKAKRAWNKAMVALAVMFG